MPVSITSSRLSGAACDARKHDPDVVQATLVHDPARECQQGKISGSLNRDAPVCVYPWRAVSSGGGVRKPFQTQDKRLAVNYLFDGFRVIFAKFDAN